MANKILKHYILRSFANAFAGTLFRHFLIISFWPTVSFFSFAPFNLRKQVIKLPLLRLECILEKSLLYLKACFAKGVCVKKFSCAYWLREGICGYFFRRFTHTCNIKSSNLWANTLADWDISSVTLANGYSKCNCSVTGKSIYYY